MAFQAHHIDTRLLRQVLPPEGAYTDRPREHFARWHPGNPTRTSDRAWPGRPAGCRRSVPVRGPLAARSRATSSTTSTRESDRRCCCSTAIPAGRSAGATSSSACVTAFRCIAARLSRVRAVARRRPAIDYTPRPIRDVVERLVDRLGSRGLVGLRLRLGRTDRSRAGRPPAGARPRRSSSAIPGRGRRTGSRSSLFSALMGGPLSPLLVDRLNLMLRLYLPFNLKRTP